MYYLLDENFVCRDWVVVYFSGWCPWKVDGTRICTENHRTVGRWIGHIWKTKELGIKPSSSKKDWKTFTTPVKLYLIWYTLLSCQGRENAKIQLYYSLITGCNRNVENYLRSLEISSAHDVWFWNYSVFKLTVTRSTIVNVENLKDQWCRTS